MNSKDVIEGINRFYDELGDVMKVEGAGIAARMLANGVPAARPFGAAMSGAESYRQELNRLASSDMSNLERYGRAGLVGLSDAAYGMIPFGNMFKEVSQEAIRQAYRGLANLGSNMVNNRAMESLNDAIWSK